MTSSRGITYLFFLIIGVMIANPALLTIAFHGPEAVTSDLDSAQLSDIYYGLVKQRAPSLVSQLFWPTIYFCVGIIALYTGSIFKALQDAPLALLGLFILVFLSSVWSEDPQDSINRSLNFLGKTLVAYQLTRYLTPNGVLMYLRECLLIVMCISIAAALLFPELGTMAFRESYAWRGLFTHKTGLGNSAALCAIICFHYFRQSGYRSIFHAATVVLAIAITVLSQSATSISALAVALSIYILVSLLKLETALHRKRLKALIAVAILSVVAVIAAVHHWDAILSLLGRDSTLTERTTIWAGVWKMILEKPALGYGYYAAWDSSNVWYVLGALQFWTPSAHNSFLQSWVELGFIGLFLFSSFLLHSLIIWFRRYLASGSIDFLLIGVIYLMLLFMASLESTLYKTQEINWFMWAMFSMILWYSPKNIRSKLFRRIRLFFAIKTKQRYKRRKHRAKAQHGKPLKKKHRRLKHRRSSKERDEQNSDHASKRRRTVKRRKTRKPGSQEGLDRV